MTNHHLSESALKAEYWKLLAQNSERVTDPQVVAEFSKLSASHFDRLVLVNGFALTMTFTAVTALRAIFPAVVLSRYRMVMLSICWFNFIFSTVLALVTNWVIVHNFKRETSFVTAMLLVERTKKLKDESPSDDFFEARFSEHLKAAKKLGDKITLARDWRFALGLASQIFTIVGFVTLLLFLKNTLSE